jgi:hypothetical protein
MPFKYFRISLLNSSFRFGQEWSDVNYEEILDPHEGRTIFITPADIYNVKKCSSPMC